MSQQVTITSVTANTPVDIYYCDSMSGSCVFVSTVSTFPYTFNVPSPYSDQTFVVKIVDIYNFEIGYPILITPTATPTFTPTPTITASYTPTQTLTPFTTPTNTLTNTISPTQTPTFTPTVTTTPLVVSHKVGQSTGCDSNNACDDLLSQKLLYNYLADAYLVPIVGVKLYSTEYNSGLYNPYNGGEQWLFMSWVSGTYAVQISDTGDIMDFVGCDVTPTPTSTQTNTPTSTPVESPTTTPTNTNTPTITPTNTNTPTTTETPTPSITQTNTQTPTITNTITNTQTPTNTITETVTPTNTITETPTITPSETPTQTPSETPTNTPSETLTNTPTPTITQTPSPDTNYLLQENGFTLDQENNSKILIT